jgi:hypothetical protein|tara:strand:- start:587 stop:790 length:204 start_codon:yes stop_codon:yes gene_type:complete
MIKQFEEQLEKIKGAIPIIDLKKKLNLCSEEEKKKNKEIALKIGAYFRNKDFEGLKKYLDHTKKNLK